MAMWEEMKFTVKSLCLVFMVFSLVGSNECVEKEKFKILGLFSHMGQSHFDFFRPLLEELALRGHELTVISYFPRKNETPNYKDISLVDSAGIYVNVIDLENALDHTVTQLISELRMLHGMAEASCSASLEKPAVKELINSNEKFDLIITEMFNSDCFLGFVHKFKAPFIGLSSHQITPWTNPRANNPDNPSYVPSIFLDRSSNMNFFNRVRNTLYLMTSLIAYDNFFSKPTQSLVENAFGPGVPPLDDIARNVSALLVNTHFSLHGSRPYSNGVVEVGGLHIRKSKPLPKHLQDFLDSAKEGVLFYSWGSMVMTSSMSEKKLDMIVKALGSLKQKVIWKWEDEDLQNKPKNVLIQKWLPQFDVLSHPNVKGFLTHGGLLGVSEAIYVGVPMVVVPMFGDQSHNGAAVASRGAGLVLQYEDITDKTLGDALNEILTNPSYHKNAQAVSRAYKDRPASALETAVWWAEYVARGNGQPFLRSASADLSWYQYHLLDVIAFLSLIVLATVYVLVFLTKRLLHTLFGKKVKRTTPKANGSSKHGVHKKKA